MADEADIANDVADRFLDRALAAAATQGPRMTPLGQCHYCEEVFSTNDPSHSKKLFCDADCAGDYDREQRLKRLR